MDCLRCKKPMYRVHGHGCAAPHYVCAPCEVEYCSLYEEEEQMGDDPRGRMVALMPYRDAIPTRKAQRKKSKPVSGPDCCAACGRDYLKNYKVADLMPVPIGGASGLTAILCPICRDMGFKPQSKPLTAKQKRENLYRRIIREADNHLGDLMGEYAESQYSEQGGSVGMVEGRVVLTKDEIKDCMFEALSLTDNHGFVRDEPWGKGFDLEGLRVDRQKIVDLWFKEEGYK